MNSWCCARVVGTIALVGLLCISGRAQDQQEQTIFGSAIARAKADGTDVVRFGSNGHEETTKVTADSVLRNAHVMLASLQQATIGTTAKGSYLLSWDIFRLKRTIRSKAPPADWWLCQSPDHPPVPLAADEYAMMTYEGSMLMDGVTVITTRYGPPLRVGNDYVLTVSVCPDRRMSMHDTWGIAHAAGNGVISYEWREDYPLGQLFRSLKTVDGISQYMRKFDSSTR